MVESSLVSLIASISKGWLINIIPISSICFMRLFTFKLAIFKPFILETSTSGIEDIEHEFSEASPSPGSIMLL